jgi:hypothetical protein
VALKLGQLGRDTRIDKNAILNPCAYAPATVKKQFKL